MSLHTPKSKVATVALLSALTAIPAGAGLAVFSLPAYAQPAGDTPPPPGGVDRTDGHHMRHHGHHAMRDGDGWGERRHGRHHHGRRHDENRQMRLAQKLAGVETAIGIRSDQLDTWRDFTSKLVAFLSPPHHGRHAAMAPGSDEGRDGKMPDGKAKPGFGMFDHMLDGAIERGEKAKELKAAFDKLKGVLTPEQMDQARTLMQPHHRRHGHWGHHHWRHHQWGARADGARHTRGPKPDAQQQDDSQPQDAPDLPPAPPAPAGDDN